MDPRIRDEMLQEWHARNEWRRYATDAFNQLTPQQEAVALRVLGPKDAVAWLAKSAGKVVE